MRPLSIMWQRSPVIDALLLLVLVHVFSRGASHPCTDEVASACADRPGEEVESCLSDPEAHDQETTISSECTDFIALNKACAEDIESFCDGGTFTDDTILCLTKWTDRDNLSPKCQNVLKWAVVEEPETDEAPVTDELGMSEKDYAEKKAWQAKRKVARGAAIEKLASDKIRDQEKAALEEYKKDDPEGYAQQIQQEAEEKRQKEEFAKMERKRAAAFERQKRKDAGLPEEEETVGAGSKPRKSKSTKATKESSSGSWVSLLASLSFILFLGAVGMWFFPNMTSGNKANSKKSKNKKTQGR